MTGDLTTLRRLTVIVCAAGPAADVSTLIEAAHGNGWTVGVVATPQAVGFVDVPVLVELTGQPVRSEQSHRAPGGNRAVGQADALIVAPATFNTINKLATGIADNYALTLAAELIGLGTPVVIVPFVNAALASRAPYAAALQKLRAEGIRIIAGKADNWLPHLPGLGDSARQRFPWLSAMSEAVSAATA